MKILFFGAGVLGSLYAAKTKQAGFDVSLLARGNRLRDLQQHGIVLKEFKTKAITKVKNVRVLSEMPTDEYFDLCVVLVQKNQLQTALNVLKKNTKIPTILFMHNFVNGVSDLKKALGQDRIVIGHANAGGEREKHIVHYMIAEKMPLGELNGEITERLKKISSVFQQAGFSVAYNQNIESWKKYHVALAVPFAHVMQSTNNCNLELSQNKEQVLNCLSGMKESFKVLEKMGLPMEPPKLKWVMRIPNFILAPLFQRFLRTKIADIGMARHLRNAQAEMAELSDDFFKLLQNNNQETPVLNRLRANAASKTKVAR